MRKEEVRIILVVVLFILDHIRRLRQNGANSGGQEMFENERES